MISAISLLKTRLLTEREYLSAEKRLAETIRDEVLHAQKRLTGCGKRAEQQKASIAGLERAIEVLEKL